MRRSGQFRAITGEAIGAWFARAIGDDRKAPFYEKIGSHRARVMTIDWRKPGGMFPLDVWHYEIGLSATG